MDKQKEIATMQMIAAEMRCPFDCINDCFRDTTHGFCARARLCEFLAEKGYGNVRAAIEDVAERIKTAILCEFADNMTFKMVSRIEKVIDEVCENGH